MAQERPTEEEIEKMIAMVRVLVGDVPQSVFYPVLSDEEIEVILELENWNVMRAAKRVAVSVAFYLSTTNYKERTGDIEVINNASMQYQRVLDKFLNDAGESALPEGIMPYAAGISIYDVCASNSNPDKNRSPLARITPCLAWWTEVRNYYKCAPKAFFEVE